MKRQTPADPIPDDDPGSEECMLDPPTAPLEDDYDTDLWFDGPAQQNDDDGNLISRHQQLIDVLNRFH